MSGFKGTPKARANFDGKLTGYLVTAVFVAVGLFVFGMVAYVIALALLD